MVRMLRWVLGILISLTIHILVFWYIAGDEIVETTQEVVEFQFIPPVQVFTPPVEEEEPPPEVTEEVIDDTSDAVEEVEELDEDIPEEAPPPQAPPPNATLVPRSEPEYVPFYAVDTRATYVLSTETPLTYPLIEKKRGQESNVMIEVDIDEEGNLRDLRIVKSGGANFDQAALNAMRAATYTPAIRNGEPVAVRTRFLISFKLE